jgi:hypothetical protein
MLLEPAQPGKTRCIPWGQTFDPVRSDLKRKQLPCDDSSAFASRTSVWTNLLFGRHSRRPGFDDRLAFAERPDCSKVGTGFEILEKGLADAGVSTGDGQQSRQNQRQHV